MVDVRWFRALSVSAALLVVGAARAAAADAAEAIARGDAQWQRRAEGAQGGRAARAPIAAAVTAYEEALRADPTNLEASWKLLRALWFEGDYVATSNDERQKVFGRGKAVSESAWAVIGKRVGAAKLDADKPSDRAAALRGIPEAAPLLLWTAADWGLWGDAHGKLASAREGLGARVRDWGETLVALDERFEAGAGHRVLGRLHSEAPKVPFFTGWVDHDRAITELEKATAIAPAELSNRFYLAEAILEHRPAARAKALDLLRKLAAETPRAESPVEDARIIGDAAKRLAAER